MREAAAGYGARGIDFGKGDDEGFACREVGKNEMQVSGMLCLKRRD